jgi:hypothetical protein
MKPPLHRVLWILTTVIVACSGYLYYRHATHVSNYLKECLGLRDFAITQKEYNQHQWYANVALNKDEAVRLLQRHPFAANYNRKVLDKARKPQNEFIKDCAECQYYLETRDCGVYGYVLHCLHPDQQLEILSEFGD